MVSTVKVLIGILLPFTVCSAARVSVENSGNPYRPIADRNVFRLKPPVSTPVPPPAAIELPPITLTGLLTILGKKQALITVHVPGKPAQAHILTEGERVGVIEILQVDEIAGRVEINQGGTRFILTFEKNGERLPASLPTPPLH